MDYTDDYLAYPYAYYLELLMCNEVTTREFNGPEYIGFAKTVSYISGWDSRKQKTITGTTAGAQTNYSKKLSVYKGSGADSSGVVYLGGKCEGRFRRPEVHEI